jgi:arylsulfatase A-like enzyme
MKRISIPIFLALLIISACHPQGDRPNIIYIMVDDMGYADLSCYGRKDYQTPVMDAFAHESMMFTQAYAAAPVCTPSRVGFMTGRYPARNPIGLREPLVMDSTDIDIGLSPEVPTVSSLLKKSGYATALFGKWHLGFKPEFFPAAHGFDNFFGISPGGADYVSHRYEGKDVLYENNEPVKKEGYLTDLITDRAVEYIKNTKGPFFVSLQYNSPHWPWQGPGDPAYPDAAPMSSGGNAETYANMVRNLDQNIGRVLAAIKDSGIMENTLIIFTSDNGGERYSDMGPLNGRKLQLWEGCIRVPAWVRWPARIKQGSTEQVAINMDWTVTILDAAGVRREGIPFDGISLIPLLSGDNQPVSRKLYWRISNRARWDAYRSGDWKYIRTPEGEGLYDLSKDIGETTDVKDSQPEVFQKLKAEFTSLDREMLAPYVFAKK